MAKRRQAKKWFLPFRRGKVNYEDVGHYPLLLQHDRGFAGTAIYRPVEHYAEATAPPKFLLFGHYGMSRKAALDWIKEHRR